MKGIKDNCPLGQGSKDIRDSSPRFANRVNVGRMVKETINDIKESLRDHGNVLVGQLLKSGELVDIPISHSPVKIQGPPNSSKWKMGLRKRNFSRSKKKQDHFYTRKRKISNHDKDTTLKKLKTI